METDQAHAADNAAVDARHPPQADVDDIWIGVRWKTMRERSDSYTDAPIELGTLVRYDGLSDGGPEYGVVVSCWLNPQVKFYDCYVAFFGPAIPAGEPEQTPYVLRYASVSLARLESAENGSQPP